MSKQQVITSDTDGHSTGTRRRRPRRWRVMAPLVALAGVAASGIAAATPATAAAWTGDVRITSPVPSNVLVGGAVTVTAEVRNLYDVAMFIVDDPRVCTLTGAAHHDDAQHWSQRVTMVGAGTCTILAAAGSDEGASQSFTVSNPAPAPTPTPTPTPKDTWFTTTAPTHGTVGTSVTVAAAVGVLYEAVRFGTEDPRVCRTTGAAKHDDALHWSQQIALVGSGTCSVFAYTGGSLQADDTDSGGATQDFSVRQLQSIQGVLARSKVVPAGSFEAVVTRGGGSGNPVLATMSPLSGAGVCTVTTTNGRSRITFVKPGYCKVDFNQAGNDAYWPATTTARVFTVTKGQQAITFTSAAPTTALPGDTFPRSLAVGGASGNPVYLHLVGSSDVCYLSAIDYAVHFRNAGTCAIHAVQLGNASFFDAPEVVRNVTVINPWADGTAGNPDTWWGGGSPIG